ncbi:MAG: chemotaxis response regulator protein-glutamate methylesterase [Bacillota bacterium]|nr:chemotaxis response regulator protein-glutamate methylesterase [Bacillota bacterium]
MDLPIRVLVVDDSAFTRKVVSDMLGSDPDIVVVDVARDGRAAVEKARALRPDVITMDVEMPVMDGLAALRAIMADHPVAVVMLSALTQQGAATTIQALELGAIDFVPKPSHSMTVGLGDIRDQLVAKVKLAAGAKVRVPRALRPGRVGAIGGLPPGPGPGGGGRDPRRADGETARPGQGGVAHVGPDRHVGDAARREAFPSAPWVPTPVPTSAPAPVQRRESDIAIVIGSSTGGPSALNQVLTALPADIGAGILVVQHMPAGFTRSLAARLDESSAIAVKEAEAGDRVVDGVALVAPGGHHMSITGEGEVALSTDPPRNGVRPSVDTTMESAARVYGDRLVGVVLTGMGRDGASGVAAIKAAGGRSIAEHESTCVIYGMPKAVIEQGLADVVVPLHEVAGAIIELVREIG